jgi:PTH1 family peptidyl-tRNA hydrolase
MPASDTDSDLIIVGLGNPGDDYAHTRHNVGWDAIDELARRLGADVSRKRWHSRIGSVTVDGRRVWLVEPQTFMNMSGRAVKEAARDVDVGPEAVWVVHDEVDLPPGRIRIKVGGSAAGHNGIRSIIGSLGGDGFTRFRIGVGKPPRRGSEAGVRHVLGRFRGREKELMDAVVAGVADALEMALHEGVERAMTRYNRNGSVGPATVEEGTA